LPGRRANRKIEKVGRYRAAEAINSMTLSKHRSRWSKPPLLSAIAGIILIVSAAVSAQAQQGQIFPPPSATIPQSQNQGGASVLELPAMPGGQSGGATATLPRIAPQPGADTATLPRLAPQPGGAALTLPSRDLRSQQGYRQVTVTVTDQEGRYVTDLRENDFKLLVDGQPRQIAFFRQDLNTPVSVGIIVDTSGSMQPKLAQARAAITEFVRNLNPQDDVFLFAFSSRPFLLQPFTTNHYLILSRLELLHAYGQTALFDTILDGLLMVQHGRYDKKALLVITDGMDNTSEATLGQVIAQARRMGVLIYSIGIGDPNVGGGAGGPLSSLFGGADIDEVDARTLDLLSSETGAKTYIIREVGDGAALRDACASISRELREQYTIGFVAPDASRGGYRTIHVDVPSRPGDHVRVRKGIEVGPGAESASSTYP